MNLASDGAPEESLRCVAEEIRVWREEALRGPDGVDDLAMADYISGNLGDEERGRIEQQLARSPELQEIVEVVRDVVDGGQWKTAENRRQFHLRPPLLVHPETAAAPATPRRKRDVRFSLWQTTLVATAASVLVAVVVGFSVSWMLASRVTRLAANQELRTREAVSRMDQMARQKSKRAEERAAIARRSEGERQRNVLMAKDAAALKVPASPGEQPGRSLPVAARGSREAFAVMSDSPLGVNDGVVLFRGHFREPGFAALEARVHDVTSLAFSAEGQRIVAVSGDGTTKAWDASTGGQVGTFKSHGYAMSVSRDAAHLALAGTDGSLKVWDAETGEEVLALAQRAWDVTSSAFSPDGKRIVSGSRDGKLHVYDASTGREIHTLAGHTGDVHDVTFDPQGKRIASAGRDGTVRIWDSETGEEVLALSGHSNGVTSVAFDPGGTRIASGSFDKTIRVWDATTGDQLLALKGHDDGVTSVAFSPDGTQIASGSCDKTIRVWNAATGAQSGTFKGHTNSVAQVLFSPDGTRLVSGGRDGTVRMWGFGGTAPVLFGD